jgi:hypothetical protein
MRLPFISDMITSDREKARLLTMHIRTLEKTLKMIQKELKELKRIARSISDKSGRKKYPHSTGPNPCSEVVLEPHTDCCHLPHK